MKTTMNYSYAILHRVYNLLVPEATKPIELDTFIQALRTYEEAERGRQNKKDNDLWFKFKGVGLVYDIREIEKDLSQKGSRNYEFLVEQFKEAINNPDHLIINFS